MLQVRSMSLKGATDRQRKDTFVQDFLVHLYILCSVKSASYLTLTGKERIDLFKILGGEFLFDVQ